MVFSINKTPKTEKTIKFVSQNNSQRLILIIFMKKEKILQVVNLAPSESWIEKLTEIHPMRQIAYATIIQALVFFGMLGAFKLIGSVV